MSTPLSPFEINPPTRKQLLTSLLAAVAGAAVILVAFVLPAEYAIDPTHIGRALGLTEMNAPARTLQVKDVIGGNETYREVKVPDPGDPVPLPNPAVAPVADVRNYDTIYQERYVGLPTTDSAAYHDASAVHFAAGLKGDLLVIHGTGDDNVHYQGTEQLVNALVAAGKQFQMMAYPNRTHGIYEGPGTTAHLFTLMTNYIRQHLPTGPRPQSAMNQN